MSHQQTEISNLFRMWGRMSLRVQGLIWDAGGVGEERSSKRKRSGSGAGRKANAAHSEEPESVP